MKERDGTAPRSVSAFARLSNSDNINKFLTRKMLQDTYKDSNDVPDKDQPISPDII
jgi:hypothetical protein